MRNILVGIPGPTSNLAYLTITSDLVRTWLAGATTRATTGTTTEDGWDEFLAGVRGAGEAVQLGVQEH